MKRSRLPNSDQCFDDRLTQLQKNIYQSPKGQLRLAILQRDLAPMVVGAVPRRILDAGCGLGMMSHWAYQHGHRVLACDHSQEMINAAKKHWGDLPRLQFHQASIQGLHQRNAFEIIFCHAVLEWVADQNAFLAQLRALLKQGGYLSLMFYNSWAREIAQLVYGNFDYVDHHYEVRQCVKLTPHWPCAPDELEKTLLSLDFSIDKRSGIRVFYDILRKPEDEPGFMKHVLQHEQRISTLYPYWQLGRYVHFLLRKNEA